MTPIRYLQLHPLTTPISSIHCRFNQVKPKNDVEARVYEVLSHKNWGASTTLMNEIAQDTFDYERCECKIAKLL